MVQIQLVVQIDQTTNHMDLQLNLLEREDANDAEREYAQIAQDLYVAIFQQMKDAILQENPDAEITERLISKTGAA